MENAKDKKEEQTKNADTSAAREMGCSCAGYMERIKAIDSMEDMEQNVWEALHMFRKLNIGSILPHLNKGEFVLMNGIYHVQKKISSEHGVKMSDLAEYTHALPPAVSRSIKALEEKGYIGYKVYGNTHQYYALVSEDEYRRNSLKQVISKYYDNSYTRVVSTLIEEEVLTIDELQKLIQQIKNK